MVAQKRLEKCVFMISSVLIISSIEQERAAEAEAKRSREKERKRRLTEVEVDSERLKPRTKLKWLSSLKFELHTL